MRRGCGNLNRHAARRFVRLLWAAAVDFGSPLVVVRCRDLPTLLSLEFLCRDFFANENVNRVCGFRSFLL